MRKLFKGLYKRCECREPNCIISVINSIGKFARYRQGHNSRGSNHNQWKGGRIEDGYGYWLLWMPDYYRSNSDGYVREHVYFYEQYNKLCMLPWGEVHHIIPVKDGGSNLPWNLKGMMHSQHSSISAMIDMTGRICKICYSEKTKLHKRKKTGKYYLHWYGNEIDGWICHRCYMRNYFRIYRRVKKQIT